MVKPEIKVGLLFIATLVLVLVFAYILGVVSPFSNVNILNVRYNYAGGIEEGSPVRVMGIKVGKVRKIEFEPSFKMLGTQEEVKLRLEIEIEKKAWTTIRRDSKFFINLAGVIGEKFLEISPGTLAQGEFNPGEDVRGEDPPRIDQLISQSYGLAGRIIDLVDKNQGSVTNIITQLDRLTSNFNRTLALLDKTSKNQEMMRLLDNAIKISDDVAYLTNQLRSKKSEETISLVQRLLQRLEAVDGPAIKKFFQEEGVKAHIF